METRKPCRNITLSIAGGGGGPTVIALDESCQSEGTFLAQISALPSVPSQASCKDEKGLLSVRPTVIGIVSKATLKKLLKGGMGLF